MSGLKAQLADRARSLGFARIHVGDITTYDRWRGDALARPNARYASLVHDPILVMPEAKRVVALLFAYAPYIETENEATIDAYYMASNAAHAAARRLGGWLADEGVGVRISPPLPHKSAVVAMGLARYGKNCLSHTAALGSRYAIELMLIDEAWPLDDTPDRSAPCGACDACIRACPTGALTRDGLSVDRCLRTMNAGVVAEQYRAKIGRGVIGCDICQRACPRNRTIEPVAMPEPVKGAIDPARLLAGDMGPLAGLIGRNYARKKRMQARACLMAANLGRRDLMALIEPLASDEDDAVRAHAAWALAQLR